MARDNAACNRAIRKAWARERELVLAGKGSRNWTPEQREQLITKGKVYDADGKAFIGQHMKSVSGFPDNQGDADNIQLLSQEEHLEAHKGDWHNVTNWYYDPDTKTFYDFDVYDYSKFPPDDYCNFHPEECRVSFEVISEEKVEERKPSEKKNEEPPKSPKASPQKQTTVNKTSQSKVSAAETKAANEKGKKFKDGLEALGSKVKSGGKIAGRFIAKHWKKIAAVGLAIGAAVVEEKLRSGGSGSGGDNYNHDDDSNSPDYLTPDEDEALEYEDDLVEDDETESSSKGTPKSPHDRTGYWGDRWKKDENGNRYKSPSWISPTRIHPDQDDDESEDE